VLKDLRRILADGKPAYVVATDAMLQEIAVARPRSLEQLRRVPGMGPKKLELYGPAILAAVAATLDDDPPAVHVLGSAPGPPDQGSEGEP
jgi:superfamily II DNA helicase RecQ